MRTIIKNGKLILPDQILEDSVLVTENGRITHICPGREWRGEGRVIDACGKYVMPGMIDIHSDMIEAYIQPRSTAVMDFQMGLHEAERVLAGCGITTMFHSISMFKEGAWDVKEIRQAPQVKKLASLILRYRHQERLIRHRYHLRYEIDNLACYEGVRQMIEDGLVDLLSFMDHSPGQGQYKNLEIYRKHQPNEGKDLSEEEFQKLVESEQNKEMVSFEKLKELADLALSRGISVASHNDDTLEKLKVNKALGVKISEFPITLEVAKAAKEAGFMTVLGAPNILLGGSHSGNLSALAAIREGAASVLVSDYYPQSLLYAVFWLSQREGMPLWEAVRYVSLNPARAVGLDREIGSLECGKQADFLIIEPSGKMPVLEQVYVAGECVFQCRYRKADGEEHH